MRVLIAEDDVALASFVRKGLEAEHYAVDVSHDGEQARAMVGELDYDLLVLDLNLPRMDGVSILRQLRTKKPSMPILILTSRNRVEDRVQCLDLGADDYMGKPFSFAELSARIRALLRRSHVPAASVLAVEDLKLERVERRVERAGKRIELTSKEFSLLEYLMLNAGRRVTRAMMIEHVWNLSFDTSTNIVDVYVNFLRVDFKAGLVSAEHSTYREFLGGIPERSYLGSVRLAPLGASALIQIDFAIAFPLIDVLLGGEGVGAPAARQFTEIEEQILETVMRIICRELQNAWQSLELEFVFEQRQDPDRVQNLLAADERILSLSFELTMKDSRGLMSIALPAVISAALLRKISATQPRSKAMLCTPEAGEHLQRRLLNCQFRMDLELGLSVSSAAEITSLTPGHILVLKQRADGMAALVVEGHPVFAARIVRIGEARAAQVTAPLQNQFPQEETSC